MELNLMFCETEDDEGDPAIFSHSDPDPAPGDIPASLASYFETSQSRAAACERLILQQLEDSRDGTAKLRTELNEGVRKSRKKITGDSGDDKSNTEENEEDFAANVREHQARETETRRRRETDFQEELRRNMEAEKRQQVELELRQRSAQEQLDQELLLRQELIGDFKKQVEQERRMIEEEKNRRTLEEIKLKEEKRKTDKDEKKKRKQGTKFGEDEIRGDREEMRRLVEHEEEKKREENEKAEVRRKEENRREEEKGCFTMNGKLMMMDDVERKMDETKLGDELEAMKEKDDGEKRREEDLRLGSLSEVQVKEEEKEGREEVQLQRKTSSNEMHLKEGEEKRKTEERKSRLEKCLRRKRRDKEMEGQGSETATQKEEENKVRQERSGRKGYERENREIEGVEKAADEEKRQEELMDLERKVVDQINDGATTGAEVDKLKTETGESIETTGRGAADGGGTEGKKDAVKEEQPIDRSHQEENKGGRHSSTSPQDSEKTGPGAEPSVGEATSTPPAARQRRPDGNARVTRALETAERAHSEPKAPASPRPPPASLHARAQQKRLSWTERCAHWSQLSLQNKRRQKGSSQSRGRPRRAAGVSGPAPLCPRALLRSTGGPSLQEVTTVTLEDLPACGLSTLAQCERLQRLTLRRCGIRSLEGISRLQELCYVDLEGNDISSVDCENMGSLRVLRLAHNKLTSIHGLSGADSLDVLDLSHNSITRIAGLESLRRLQRLSVDHNQLISTKGLRDVYTLLHLDCSHNHLAKVEGLENSALLHTLDLRSNSLTEPPGLDNQVLLRELLLDDNSISSLRGLAACWLPLLQRLAVPQNRITQLPSMTDFVSLKNLDLSFNCLSELRDVCESLEGCLFLQEVHLTGNPLQQETDWRSRLQRAVPGLRASDGQQTHSLLSSPASRQLSLAPDPFLTLCQVQLQQTQDLEQRLSRMLRNAPSSLDAMKSCCHHLALALQLAEDQRFAHEYGDTTVSEEHTEAGQTVAERSLDLDSRSLEKLTDPPRSESPVRRPPDIPGGEQHGHQLCRVEDAADEKGQATFGGVPAGQWSETESNRARGFVHVCPSKGERISTSLDIEPDNFARKNAAAAVLQRTWRTYRHRSLTADAGGERKGHAQKLFVDEGSAGGRHRAATVIQAFWRGCALRRRLASALDALARADTGEDDTLEEVDVEEFVVDEQTLEDRWTMTFSDDPPPPHHPVTEQNLSPKVVLEPKQAWAAEGQRDSVAERCSAGGSSGSISPASTSIHSGLSERSEQILREWGFADSRTALLMLKRAKKMKATKPQQKKRGNPSGHVAFRGCSYQMSPAEAGNGPARRSRRCLKVGEAQLGLEWAEGTEQMRWQQAQRQVQAALADRHSDRGAFLPDINSSALSRGRVQLAADPAYADPPSTEGPSSRSSLTAQLVCRRTLTPASKGAPAPKRVTSPVVNKQRISFRDKPVQLSVGWGGGKKRDRLPK